MMKLANPWLANRPALFGAALAIGLIQIALYEGRPSPARAADVTLAETGSTLIHPLFKVWADEYMKTHPGVTITSAATNSVAGAEQAISGAVQIGASDAYMSDAEAKQNPLIINVPMAISAQTVNYNIPDLNDHNLRLSGPVLAGIYAGKIRAWDDPAIAALNPGVKLPHNDIAPIHRSDPSGDTFVFTQYLSFSTEKWENRIGFVSPESWQKRTRLRHDGRLARDARGVGRGRQFRHGGQTPRYFLFDWLCRDQLSRRHRQGGAGNCGASELRRRVPAADARVRSPRPLRPSVRAPLSTSVSPWSTRRDPTPIRSSITNTRWSR